MLFLLCKLHACSQANLSVAKHLEPKSNPLRGCFMPSCAHRKAAVVQKRAVWRLSQGPDFLGSGSGFAKGSSIPRSHGSYQRMIGDKHWQLFKLMPEADYKPLQYFSFQSFLQSFSIGFSILGDC